MQSPPKLIQQIYKNDLILADYIGNIYLLDFNELQNNKKKLVPIKINSNLETNKILDILGRF
mgnify:CR=1 FL=1